MFPHYSDGISSLRTRPQNVSWPECAEALEGHCKYFIGLLGAEPRGQVTLFRNGKGSSVLRELTSDETRQVSLPMRTLNDLLETERLTGPSLLKLDVQGSTSSAGPAEH